MHYKYPDGRPYPEEECPITRARLTGEKLADSEDWLVRKDGSIMRIAFSSAPFDLPDGPGSVTAFTDVEEHLKAEKAARERDVARARAAELRDARRRIIEAADAARARLERDLHDGAQQQLVNLALRLRIARGKLPGEPEEAARLLDDAIELAAAATTELRELAAGIHPAILTHRGLGPAVERLASRIPVDVKVIETPEERLPAPVEASVYFVVSEALTNVAKHADAIGGGGADQRAGRRADRRGRRRRRRRRRHARRHRACPAWRTASRRSTASSRSRACRAAARPSTRRSRCPAVVADDLDVVAVRGHRAVGDAERDVVGHAYRTGSSTTTWISRSVRRW